MQVLCRTDVLPALVWCHRSETAGCCWYEECGWMGLSVNVNVNTVKAELRRASLPPVEHLSISPPDSWASYLTSAAATEAAALCLLSLLIQRLREDVEYLLHVLHINVSEGWIWSQSPAVCSCLQPDRVARPCPSQPLSSMWQLLTLALFTCHRGGKRLLAQVQIIHLSLRSDRRRGSECLMPLSTDSPDVWRYKSN